MLTFYDYSIREKIRLDMVCLGVIDVDTPVGASYIFADGELKLKQRQGAKPSS